jgi:hypothetical protein
MPFTPETERLCEMEARKIYAAIFRRPVPPVVLQRFVAASEQLHRTVDPQELDRYYRAAAACADLEALEIAARYTRQLRLLGRKFRLMVYLAETLPENQPFFVNERSSLPAGLWRSFIGVLWTAWKVLKGVWLLKRYAYA